MKQLVVAFGLLMCVATGVSSSGSLTALWQEELHRAVSVVEEELPRSLRFPDKEKYIVKDALPETFFAKPTLVYSVQLQDSQKNVFNFQGMLPQGLDDDRGIHWSQLVNESNPDPILPWLPRMAELEIVGPAELHVETETGQSGKEVALRMPHLVEGAGALQKIKVVKDADVAVIGPSQISLKSPLDVDFILRPGSVDPVKILSSASSRVELVVNDPYQIRSRESRLKVRRLGKAEVEVRRAEIGKAVEAVSSQTSSSSPSSVAALSAWRNSFTAMKLQTMVSSLSTSLATTLLKAGVNSTAALQEHLKGAKEGGKKKNGKKNEKGGKGGGAQEKGGKQSSASSSSSSSSSSSKELMEMRVKKILSASIKSVLVYEFAVELDKAEPSENTQRNNWDFAQEEAKLQNSKLRNQNMLADVAVVKDAKGKMVFVGMKDRVRFDTMAAAMPVLAGNATNPMSREFSADVNEAGMSLKSPF